MEVACITALGVGGATVVGSIIGFIFKHVSQRVSEIVLSFAAGVMLSATVWGLIMPSLEQGGRFALTVTISGIFAGAICLNVIDRAVRFWAKHGRKSLNLNDENKKRAMLFVTAIAMHNLPEGIAAGVGFGTGDMYQAFLIASGIAVQNVPEGMVIIGPMLSAGVSPFKTMLIAIICGLSEVIGTLIGFFAISLASAILPFALAFAGGTMLYIIVEEMIPETHSHNTGKSATYALLVGFCLTFVTDAFI